MLPEHADRIPDGTSLEMNYETINQILQAHMEQSGQWLLDALSKNVLKLWNTTTAPQRKINQKASTRWQLMKRKGKRLLIKVYHRLVRR